jgi:hypothetical protein
MRCPARAATPTCRPASPQGIQSAGETGGAAGLMGMGMATGMLGGRRHAAARARRPAADDPVAKLKKAKEMLDLGLITQADYDAAKAKALASKPGAGRPCRTRPTPPRYTGPGSPQDVPPHAGHLPRRPATLPPPIREELEAPDPVALDTAAQELKDGLNRCPKCGATDIRHKPGSTCWSACTAATSGSGERVEEEFGFGEGHDQLRRHRHRLRRARHRRRRRRPGDLQVQRLRRRGHGQHAEPDDGALPLVPARVRRQRAGAQRRGAGRRAAVPHQEGRRGRAHPPVRRQAAAVRAEGVQGSSSRPRTSSRVPALHDRRRPGERDVAGRARSRRAATPAARQDKKTYYDADVYQVERPRRFHVDDLPLESSRERGNLDKASTPTTSSTPSCRSTPRTR